MDRKQQLILTLTHWIDDNIHLPLKIEQVAERSGYSRWHLQRMFYQVMKQSLGKYIREKKLMRAAEDLRNSNETVMEISLRYGFESQQSFTRSFSGKYHLPPAAFRRIASCESMPDGYTSNNEGATG
ncbi:helix-turn-helix domain-containing protein [Tatumella citrea]|uniref:Transcriptional regulator n=1 Tax=Tatumella citrea TaxID=53336 RepID=A0A1Y0LJM5_TATCI|nr:helix-turn-helix domain-containing protein [Tatumella citrea]ARU94261.1 transcriptional regulator [Tatumella citrea]ARU98301.1 transcriptional regulator [Tatumella citrea]